VHGAFNGLNPHPLFDTAFYLRKYPKVDEAGVNPLFHYLLHGAAEGRKPHPLFEPGYYIAQCPEAARAPLMHFLAAVNGQLANPHPLFDCAGYLRAHPEAQGVNPLVDFVLRAPRPATAGAAFGR
jgi:hypothetical protein